jgi:hypothetical protein
VNLVTMRAGIIQRPSQTVPRRAGIGD